MTLLKHELRQSLKTTAIWTVAIAGFVAVCVFLYPEMKGEMEQVSEIFASMGAFTAAFGMDRLNFGTLLGFYAVECSNILGIGGAFFAAMLGAGILSREEKDHTAEFLLAHPVSRVRVLTCKFAALVVQLAAMNAVVLLAAFGSVAIIGEEINAKTLVILHLANFLVQLVLVCICFMLSAFVRRGSVGVGIGVAALFYCVNLVANITESAKWMKWLTPFAFAESADIVEKVSIDLPMAALWLAVGAVCTAVAFWYYNKKDIA